MTYGQAGSRLSHTQFLTHGNCGIISVLLQAAEFEEICYAAVGNRHIPLTFPDSFRVGQIHGPFCPWSGQHMTCFQQEQGKAHVLLLLSSVIHGRQRRKMLQSGPPYGRGVGNGPGHRIVTAVPRRDSWKENNLRLPGRGCSRI